MARTDFFLFWKIQLFFVLFAPTNLVYTILKPMPNRRQNSCHCFPNHPHGSGIHQPERKKKKSNESYSFRWSNGLWMRVLSKSPDPLHLSLSSIFKSIIYHEIHFKRQFKWMLPLEYLSVNLYIFTFVGLYRIYSEHLYTAIEEGKWEEIFFFAKHQQRKSFLIKILECRLI